MKRVVMSIRRCAPATVAMLLVCCFCVGSVAKAQPVADLQDDRIRELVDAGVLRGAPGGDLELDRAIQGGEFVTLIDRVLKMPPAARQHLATGTETGDSEGWVRAYVYWRSVTRWFQRIGSNVRQSWFDLRYRQVTDQPWDLPRTHWMSASLRDAYLNYDLIDLSFKPMWAIDGSTAIDLILAAAGYGGEVAAVHEQMPEATPDEVRRFVCAQHGMGRLMEYAGARLTRGDAVLMVWLLMERRLARS